MRAGRSMWRGVMLVALTFAPWRAAADCVTNESALLDLTSWSVIQYLPFGQPPAEWVIINSNVVEQTINADPSILLGPFTLQNDTIEGSWQVGTIQDDDFIGFVFGYQDTNHFYLFDWKQADQVHALGAIAERGMSLKVVNLGTDSARIEDFYATYPSDTNRVRTLYHNLIQWQRTVDYGFRLEFFAGQFTITVSQGPTVLASFTVNDSTYTSGQFGFYNFSQGNVRYSGFTRQVLQQRPILSVADVSVTEGDSGTTNLIFKASLSNTNCEITRVDYLIIPGTATAGEDYSGPFSGSLIFPPGETNRTITVPVLGDLISEPNETLFLILTNPVKVVLGTTRAVGMIIDNELPPLVSLRRPSPNTCLALPTNLTLTAEARVNDGEVSYVEFYDGVSRLGQTDAIPYEIPWSNISAGNHLLTAVAVSTLGMRATSAPVAISASFLSTLSVADVSVVEGNTTTNAAFTITLSPPSCRAVTVTVTTANGSALAGPDYVALATNLTFVPGQTAKTVLVPIRGDTENEPNETFSVCLSNPVGATLSNSCGTGTIINDDGGAPPTVAIVEPLDGGVAYAPPGIILIRADAQDTDGFVERVDFYLDGAFLATATNAPFAITWANDITGTYVLTALARDDSGLRATSAPVHLTLRTCDRALDATPLTNQIRCLCEEVVFSTIVTSAAPVGFVWKVNDVVLRNETNSTLVLRALKAEQAGTYTVEISSPCATISRSATLAFKGGGGNPISFTNSSRITINDNNVGLPYPSPITVECVPGSIRHLSVTLDGVTHNYPDDVDILLVGPTGTALKLMSDAGGATANKLADVQLSFSDRATDVLPDSLRITPGIYMAGDYAPTEIFSPPAPTLVTATNFLPFLATNPNGTWSLFVRDDTAGDAGFIGRGWSLQIEWEGVRPRLSSPIFLFDGRLQMTLESNGQMTHIIEASSDLIDWTPIYTVTPSAPTVLVYDPQPPNGLRRFYRAVCCP